jgi:preprotein translocase subunit SecG
MTGLEITLGIILIVFAVFLVVAVLLQSSKDQGLGVIGGAGESFLGKDRSSRLDKLLNKLTPIIAGAFAIIVLVMYLIVE